MRMKRAIILPMLVLFGSCLYIGTFLYLIVIEESQGMLYQHLYLVLHCAFSVRIIPCIAALIHRLWSNRVKNENGFFAINRTHNFLFGTSVPLPVELKVWGKIFAQTEKRASCNAYEWRVLNPRSSPLRSMSPNMRRRNRRSVALPMSAD